jgi:hypothetical protein
MSFPAYYGGALCTLQIQARKNDSFRLLVFAACYAFEQTNKGPGQRFFFHTLG